ncbi:hypothetical protein CEXT_392881 [Caerostris extrusa]|uniref:Uncharacterized protein n=1 Tax=Caerostris extrusa TaxID=172846 RepID=A0AAV4TB21_CAEEX|nr:hypothetical protein CEXT_392881 [Caerostris extrusa]
MSILIKLQLHYREIRLRDAIFSLKYLYPKIPLPRLSTPPSCNGTIPRGYPIAKKSPSEFTYILIRGNGASASFSNSCTNSQVIKFNNYPVLGAAHKYSFYRGARGALGALYFWRADPCPAFKSCCHLEEDKY